jgi:tungstate transport system substrate-binding protein
LRYITVPPTSVLMTTKTTLQLALALLVAAQVQVHAQQPSIILATTTSTQDTGLLDSLVPMFAEQSGIGVKVIAVGTGAALEMARQGDADAVLVHAPDLEQQYIESGDLIEGHLVMHNDFIIVGPGKDPAAAAACAARDQPMRCALQAIARVGPFISRGDRSGTHQMELRLWREAGINPDSVTLRTETGQGMGATLDIAIEKRGYTLTDRGTWLAHRAGHELRIIYEGDPMLRNIYHVYVVNPQKHSGVHLAEARRFAEFLVSPPVQALIGRFGKVRYGQPRFTPDAQ